MAASGVPDTSATHRVLAPVRAQLAARDDAIVRAQVALAQIAAPTGDEHDRAAWVLSQLRRCGLDDVRLDDAGNAIGRRAGQRDLPPVVVCAHLDTVFPRGTKIHVRRDGPRLVGPSINDNSRGVAVMLALAEVIGAEGAPSLRPIEFVATTGEEGAGNLRGATHYFADRGRGAAAMIALDGAGDERIVHRALGSQRFRIAYAGAGGHSWAAYGAPNAVHAAAGAAARLAALRMPATPRTSLSVGRIGGGISVNTIPDYAWLEVDLRSTNSGVLERYARQIALVSHAVCNEENGRRTPGSRALTCTVELIGSRPCGETPASHPLVQVAQVATTLVGRQPELSTASTDANVPISQGIPAIAIGAGGRGGDAHTSNEWFENADGTRGIARALTIVIAATRIAAD